MQSISHRPYLVVLSALAGLCWSSVASAHQAGEQAGGDFPVIEQVSYVLDCMDANGGQNVETLYTCSCRMERLAEQFSFGEYEEAVVYRRFKNMPGERGGLFRESEYGDAKVKNLGRVLAEVERACPLVKRSRQAAPKEVGSEADPGGTE